MRNTVVGICLFGASVFLSCSKPNCIDSNQYSLAMKYYNSLKSTYKGEGVLIGESLLANMILVEITEIDSKASYGDVTVYSKKSDFELDMSKWEDWIANKSCKANLEVMKEREQEILLNSDWVEKN